MYLNKVKIGAFKVANAFIIGICGVTSFSNLIFSIFLMTSEKIEKSFTAIILILIILFLMSVKIGIIIWRAILIHRLSKCRIYNSLLDEDHDGIIAYSSIASMIGRPEANVIKDIMWLVKEKILINVTCGVSALRVDLLAGENEFIRVVCPTCGAQSVIRKNGGGKCDHCGTFMRLKENQNV